MSAIRSARIAFLLAGVGVPWVGLPTQAQTITPRVTRLGSHKTYGPGIVAASTGQVRFELTRAAYLIVVRVHPDGSIDPLLPEKTGESTLRAAGSHIVEAPRAATALAAAERELEPVLSRQALERAGRRVRPPAAGADDEEASPTAYWWLVVASDVPTKLDELLARLEAFRTRTFASVGASVRALSRELVAKRAETWATYSAPVEP